MRGRSEQRRHWLGADLCRRLAVRGCSFGSFGYTASAWPGRVRYCTCAIGFPSRNQRRVDPLTPINANKISNVAKEQLRLSGAGRRKRGPRSSLGQYDKERDALLYGTLGPASPVRKSIRAPAKWSKLFLRGSDWRSCCLPDLTKLFAAPIIAFLHRNQFNEAFFFRICESR